ncbi:MAG TPA: hypothetical protein VNJ07_01175 [Chitinophagales bacterium]|nr:hypothetical protein [Chitinophagales bacterium]
MADTSFLRTKRAVTDKIYRLLHEFTEELKASPAFRNFRFPPGTDFKTGKISRGENYKGLPYVILDFPKNFSKEGIFAFRTMFWWGNYFSFTLHLKGKPLELYRNRITAHLRKMKKNDLLIYTGENEWEHDLSDEHYRKFDKKSEQALKKSPFLKLGVKIKLTDYTQLLKKGLGMYEMMLKMMED